MTEDLKHLIDRIHGEAVEKAEADAERIIANARATADRLLKDAESKAKARTDQAAAEAEDFTTRGREALEQAARDLVLSTGRRLENLLGEIVRPAVRETLDASFLRQLLPRLVIAYAERADSSQPISVLLAEDDQSRLTELFRNELNQSLSQGVELKIDDELTHGFRISMNGEHAFEDFSDEAITEALMYFLRPPLSEVVSRLSQQQDPDPEIESP